MYRPPRRPEVRPSLVVATVVASLLCLVSRSRPLHLPLARAVCRLLFRPAVHRKRRKRAFLGVPVLPKKCHPLCTSVFQWAMLSSTRVIASSPRADSLVEATCAIWLTRRESARDLRCRIAPVCGARCPLTDSRRDALKLELARRIVYLSREYRYWSIRLNKLGLLKQESKRAISYLISDVVT